MVILSLKFLIFEYVLKQKVQIKIFITGIYRSGTTLVSRILNNHSKLWVTYDLVHFMRFSYDRYNPVQLRENAETLVKEIHARILKRWNVVLDVKSVMSALDHFTEISYRKIYEAVMESLASQHKGSVLGWGEKTNVCWGQIPDFLKMFPDGKVIHILRDPRDVMCSYREMSYEPGHAYLDSAFASLDSFVSAKQFSITLGKENYYCLKYEDLVNNPIRITQSICSFLGIEFEDILLNALKFTDKQGGRWKGDSSFDKDLRAISKKPLNRWKTSARNIEIFFVEMINRPVMHEFNYTLSGIHLTKEEWIEFYDILNDRIINSRYKHWLKTGEGIEAYPSDPLLAS